MLHCGIDHAKTVAAVLNAMSRTPDAQSLVLTSNIVEATFDFVATDGNNVERVS